MRSSLSSIATIILLCCFAGGNTAHDRLLEASKNESDTVASSDTKPLRTNGMHRIKSITKKADIRRATLRQLQQGPAVAPPLISSITIDPPAVTVGDTFSVTLCVSGAGDSVDTRVPFQIVFSLDTSGSMSGTKLQDAKSATNFLVDQLISQDLAAVVAWTTGASVVSSLTNDFAVVTSAVNSLSAGGGTNLNAGLSTAINILTSSGNAANTVKVVIFLTDGQGSYTTFENGGAASDAADNGIIIYSIGLGSGADPDPLIDMADNTGGRYLFSPTPEELQGIYDEILRTIQSNTLPHNIGVVEYVNDGIEIDCATVSPPANSCNATEVQWSGLDGGNGLRSNETVCVSFDAAALDAGDSLSVLANNTVVTYTPINDPNDDREVIVSDEVNGAAPGLDLIIQVQDAIVTAPPVPPTMMPIPPFSGINNVPPTTDIFDYLFGDGNGIDLDNPGDPPSGNGNGKGKGKGKGKKAKGKGKKGSW